MAAGVQLNSTLPELISTKVHLLTDNFTLSQKVMIKALKKVWASVCKGYYPDDVLVLTKQVKSRKKYKKVKRLRSR